MKNPMHNYSMSMIYEMIQSANQKTMITWECSTDKYIGVAGLVLKN